MTERVSLVEAYDNKDVVSQIYRIREIAQGAEDKSAEAVQKADAAVAVVPEVEAAVATANAASQAAQQAAAQVTDCVKKTGSTVPQVISGTGGLQIAGDLSVGGDLTVSADGHVHMDASDIEVANMAIEKSGQKTVLSNDYGIDAPDTVVGTLDAAIVNAKRLIEEIDAKLNAYSQMVRTTGNQIISGTKTIAGDISGLSNISNGRSYGYHSAGNEWRKRLNFKQITAWSAIFMIKCVQNRGFNGTALFVYQRRTDTSSQTLNWIYKPASGFGMKIGVTDEGLYIYQNGSDGISLEMLGQIASQDSAKDFMEFMDVHFDNPPEFTRLLE